MRRLRAWGLAIGLAGLGSCWSTPRPAAPRRDTTIALDVEQLELANGLRVVVVPEPGTSDVAVTMRYAGGSADDPPGKEGLAHLVEHLMFEHVRGDEALFDFLERRALGFNGFTTLESTIFTEHAPPAQLAELLDVEAARMHRSCAAIPMSSFARQREIVRNELREREDDDRIQSALRAAVFTANHPFGGRLATPDSLATITQEQACAFAVEHYVASNAVLVVSGRITRDEVRALLDRALGGPPSGAALRSRPPGVSPHRVTVDAPVDRPWIVLSWAMPENPAARQRLSAVVGMAAGLVDARVNGLVTTMELGAGSSRQLAIAVAPSSDISASDALANTKDVISRMGPWFGSGLYEHAQNRAIYRFVASLDHSVERDVAFAEDAAAGRDVRVSNDETLRGLRTMSRDDAHDVVRSSLDPASATIVMLHPSPHTSRGGGARAEPFREQQRRRSEDPGDARRTAASPVDADPLAATGTRTLSNGMRVVLLPMSTMPTLDIRLLFPAGTADEPAGQRGVALLAADALYAPWDADRLRFIQAGGRVESDVDFDHTELAVRGLGANLDVLLSGLATTAREGEYDFESVRAAASWRSATFRRDLRDRVALDVWREAIYGDHPYRYAGQWNRADRAATDVVTIRRFRVAHYQPRGAILIVAGRFEAADADRWIDYYFADWSGVALREPARPSVLKPLAFAQSRDTTQIAVQIAWPAAHNDRIASLVATEMLDEAMADVREQLAASYGLHAHLDELRLATTIGIAGYVDAKRAADAFSLLRDRLARLREPSDDTASLFVSARRHVVAQLSSIDTRATALADRFVRESEVASARITPDAASALTIDRILPLLITIDLSHAAILMRGPLPALTAAYGAIGRQPARLDE